MLHSSDDAAIALPALSQLRWQCRRGMLELDYLLRDFLETHYIDLAVADQQNFVRLLECTDPFLYDWLLLSLGVPADPALQRVVTLIRNAVRLETGCANS